MNRMVSVVIPHFNRTSVIKEAIASVEAQSYDDWEVIVVDDGSKETELEILKQLASDRVRIFERTELPKGHAKSRNVGLNASNGEYIYFLDSDDQMAPWCLEKRMQIVQANQGLDFWIFPVLLFKNTPLDAECLWNSLEGPKDLYRFLRSDCPWQTSSTLWRKSSLLRIEGFNEKLFYGADSDLHMRALASGLKYKKFPDALPDTFIRRSDMDRITNTVSPTIMSARRTRLIQGSHFLGANETNAHHFAIWEGQYFYEFEFLLFNVPDCKEQVYKIFDDWVREHRPSPARRMIVKTYLATTLLCKAKAYIVVRIARRIAMKLLPDYFFPLKGDFETARPSESQLAEVRKQLKQLPSQSNPAENNVR